MTTIGNGSPSPSSTTAVLANPASSSKTFLPNDRSHTGALVVTVLSAYDLYAQEQPTAVSLQVAGVDVGSQCGVRTGPPSARLKDRNSYRFEANQSTLRVECPLRQLYATKALLTVEYENNPRENLSCQLVCNTVHIHETTWLILNLEKTLAPSTSTNNVKASSMTTTNINNKEEGEEEVLVPTLRLQVRLEGPYRTEIAALVSLAGHWFHLVDRAEVASQQVTQRLSFLPIQYLLVPTVPLVSAVLVLSPILVGVLVVGLPLFLPIIVVVGGALVGVSVVVAILAASTRSGRTKIGTALAPVYHTLLSTPSGQTLVYETGPRPTPVSLVRSVLPTDLIGKLAISLLVDALGSSSYLLPVVGEAVDVAWAPLQTILIMAMYDSISPNLKYVSFFEELLPFTDVVPSATIGWLTEFGPQLIPTALKMTSDNGNVRTSILTTTRTPGGSSSRMPSVGTPTL